jgi:cellobiose dehydrogenase (acceptor)
LLHSGIGPVDQLTRLDESNSTEAGKLPPKDKWLELPVGSNLDDSPFVHLMINVPYLRTYDWVGLWNATVETRPEIGDYLRERKGPLAELQPSLGPISWQEILGADNRTRIVQWDVKSGDDGKLTISDHQSTAD